MVHNTNPVITNVLVEELHLKAQTPKPTARNTPLRYSSAYGCERQQAYASLNAEPTEPMDEAGAWVTGLGTIVHEALQDAISRKYPSAQFEVSSQIGEISGSCDALISTHDVGSHYGGTHILYELKTMGTYSFDKQVGWNRMRGTFSSSGAEGPAKKAIVQAGMNALGIESENPDIRIETIVMGSIGFEALSKNKAENMNVHGVNRFLAEFDVEREVWEPLAVQEIARMQYIAEILSVASFPDRWALDDNGEHIRLDPNGRAWQCDYCAFRSTCIDDGAGSLQIKESTVKIRSEV